MDAFVLIEVAAGADTKRLFVYRDHQRIDFHLLRTRKYADQRATIATHGLTNDQGWKYYSGGVVYRALLDDAEEAR
ncbi:hypothetical protein [Nocardiopsis synnemataformans]|uniref:hypothetical protein n=1 Tax=Nocardiopsis synnemataformans TaxID=61305 RepID=UPI003EC089A9